jgi:hypothetical protein
MKLLKVKAGSMVSVSNQLALPKHKAKLAAAVCHFL